MASIERDDDVGPEPVSEDSHRRVGAAERKVGIAHDQLGDRRPVIGDGTFDFESPETAQERGLDLRSEAAADEIRHFSDDERRHDEVEICPLEYLETSEVVIVIGVDCGVQGPASTTAIIDPLIRKDRLEIPRR